MASPNKLAEHFPWLDKIEDITDQQGFFHWELHFAQVFTNGGFDLQVGNPPWVRPRWEEAPILAELDPWFMLQEQPNVEEVELRKSAVINNLDTSFILDELGIHSGTVAFFGSISTYRLLAGTQPDLYRVFMLRAWGNLGAGSVAALIHPKTHFDGAKEGQFRAATYRHLRLHAHFQNRRLLFREVDWNKQFSINIYGARREIDFIHVSWLFDPRPLMESFSHNGEGEVPGIKHEGAWDLRGHRARLIRVNEKTLAEWRMLADAPDVPVEETKLLYPVSTAEQQAIAALATARPRLGQLEARITRGYDESAAKKDGLIRWESSDPRDWREVVLRGPQFTGATPFAKQPPNTKHTDKPVDLCSLPEDAVPSTDYRRATDLEIYRQAQDRWIDYSLLDRLLSSPERVARARTRVAETRSIEFLEVTQEQIKAVLLKEAELPYTEFYRVAWREMIPASTERSLFPAIFPPGPAHIHGVRSMALITNRETALVAGYWSALPLDYSLRIGGRGHLDVMEARAMLVPDPAHPLADALLLRTLRLNCLTREYAPLWSELFCEEWSNEGWAVEWFGLPELNSGLSPEWEWVTPIRVERARRSALVELDALVAVMVGIDIDALIALYRSRFPQLVEYEREMWFDGRGRKLAANFNQWGQGQTKEHFEKLMVHLDPEVRGPVPEGYVAPFYKADREAEYRQAHAVFSERLRKAQAGE
ncbi:Eco57I restriction-modification methylase domain-containing protein [Sphaerisporangium album]|uniref:Eco57I restriction-modification methylase domain-containing protein n=1 Tax=Sphaerisporangium album TaxID=509200 RepID=UPI0026892AE3